MKSTRRNLLFRIVLVLGLTAFSSAPLLAQLTQGPSPIEWTRQFSNSAVYAVAVDTTGVYAGGDCFLTKLAKDGSEAWYVDSNCAPSRSATFFGLTADGAAFYVTGQLSSSLWGWQGTVSKRAADNTAIWADLIAAAAPRTRMACQAIATDATGVYVAGSIYGSLAGQSPAGLDDVFVRKYALDPRSDCTSGNCGVPLWTDQFGWESSENPRGIASDGTAVYVAGWSISPIDGISGRHGFVRKYDIDGNVLATLRLKDVDIAGFSMDATGLYIAGNVWGNAMDVFVRKYDANLVELWTVQFGTLADDSAAAVASDGTGVYVTGNSYGAFPGYANSGSQDVFLRKYSSDGRQVWTYQFGTWDDDYVVAIAVDGTAVYLARRDSVSPVDGFVVKLAKMETAIEQLVAIVQTLNAKQGLINSLDAKLQNIRDSLTAANAGQRQDAVHKLQAFINACEAQSAMLGADAETLITKATEIITMLQ